MASPSLRSNRATSRSKNGNGSTDLYIGPKAPEAKEKNGLATVPEKGDFAIICMQDPTEPAFPKTWKPVLL